MAYNHLNGRRGGFLTQLSSWASSLQVAFHFLARFGRDDTFISIIDTKMLGNRNVVLHVPSLNWLGYELHGYDHEYLAHGVIKGPAHRAIPSKAFYAVGIPVAGSGLRTGIYRKSHCTKDACVPITSSALQNVIKVAKQYGDEFVVAVTVAILCQKQRDGDLWRCGNIAEIHMIAGALSDYNIPDEWCKDEDILTDIVYTNGYGDVEQMVRLLRALLNVSHGTGARGRNRLLRSGRVYD